jgi:CRP-like cAMP-binding protein
MTEPDDLRRNAVLARLPASEFEQLRRDLEIIDARVRQTVYETDAPIREVYFPLDSVFSVVAVADGRVSVEVATIGREGMVGLQVFLGTLTSPQAAFCQISGQAARLKVEAFRTALGLDSTLRQALGRLTQSTMVQISQNVVCNATHRADQRAARWLLTTHDRVGRDEFELTQEFLAQMLGIRRPTASEVAARLQDAGLIHYVRGRVSITDRKELEQASCDCYRIVRRDFDALWATD